MGFPLELLEEMLREWGFSLNLEKQHDDSLLTAWRLFVYFQLPYVLFLLLLHMSPPLLFYIFRVVSLKS